MLKYLFYLFVFLLPLQTVFLLREVFIGGEKWQYGTVGIYLSDILLVVILIFSLLEKLKDLNFQFSIFNFQSISNALILNFKKSDFFQNFKFQISNFKFVLLALVIWSFLSIFWSHDKIIAFYFSLKLLLAIGLFWSVLQIKFDWKKLVFVLMLAGTLQGVLAIGQFLTQQDFASVVLGTSQHEVFAGGTSVIENRDGRWLRAYGTFPHPNMLGGCLAIVLLFGIFFWLKYNHKKIIPLSCHPREGGDPVCEPSDTRLDSRLRPPRLRPGETGGNDSQRAIFTLIILLIIFSGLIVSFSRTAWMAFAIGLISIFIFQKEKRKELKKIIFVFFLTSLIWLSAFSPLFFSRVSENNRLEKKSLSDRAEYILEAKEIIKENFWIGAGAGNYTKIVAEKNPQRPIWQIQPAHNVFLLVFAELGLVGFLLFLILLWQIFLKTNSQFYFLLFAFYILMFFDHWLWTSHFGILFFFLAMGILEKIATKNLTA